MELIEAIQKWNELNINRAVLTFDCGGDNMGDTSWVLVDENEAEIDCAELIEFFDTIVYNRVEFYVNSDGYYMGEAGSVQVELCEDGEDFSFDKSAQSEYSENITNIFEVELPTELTKFVNDNVKNINGDQDNIVINYKRDFIVSDNDEILINQLESLIEKATTEFVPDIDSDESLEDWFTFTTNDEDNELAEFTLEGNKLSLSISNSYTTFKDSEY